MNLFDQLKKSKAIPPFLTKKGHFVVDDTIGISLLTSISFKKDNGQYLLITSSLYKAQKIYSLISSFVGKENVLLFPNDELVRAEAMAQSKEMLANRLYVLNEVLQGKTKIIVANLAAVCRYLPDPNIFKNRTINLKVGESYDIGEIKNRLVQNGYSNVLKVDQSLQFANRGDILDIYSVNNDYPCRIEFFDDQIESIRFFDLAKQTSIQQINEISILPGSDILLSENELKNSSDKIFEILEQDQKHLPLDKFENLRNYMEEVVDHLKENQIDEKLYKFYGLLTTRHYSLFDYCENYTRILVDEDALENSNKMLLDESTNYLFELSSEGKLISHLEMYQNLFSLINRNNKNTIVTSSLLKNENEQIFNVKTVPFVANKKTDAINIIHSYLNDNYQIVIALSNKEHISLLQEMLYSSHINYENLNDFQLPKEGYIGITKFNIPFGFIVPDEKIVYLTSHELFNEKVHLSRYDSRFKEATILKSYEDLQPGDYVVHEYQGIGQFIELQTIETSGVVQDYLKIAYFGNEFLYVPLSQFQLVRKYLGKEGMSPRLSHLHSKDWENTKKRIKERVNDLAERLMHLYIERSKVKGFAFQKDDELQKDFEDAFPYELTSDQQKAISVIKEDMEKPYPMDRLLCGDVGFGKTEVAFQAAFKAIDSGKQVAILCPTTLLARQHYELALERFKGFDVNIAVFSRLIPEKIQENYIKGIKEGKIHLVIGTHRLLSKDIVFNDLGLLIIDEEQRFGVEQKERLKELRTNIDVLTLTATPIPRTLQISLLGVRSLSKIDTAPSERMPIQTYVTPYKLEIVKELIERELGRDGQVFYLHNNISTLYQCASRLQKVLPNIRIAVAHGKMNREEIEDTMMRFYQGEIDVLVCTSIIENGIDVPNANMIIVEDSENYGLSQLYQIKGRVGRSNRIAYAYLMYNEHKILNEKAQKRLKAIQEFTELGSGYKIAQRDLMIRGAGDILGPEQAGFIDSIGLDMYIKLLNEAVQEKLHGYKEEENIVVNPNLSINAYIPSNYADDSSKIELYQEILSCQDRDSLMNIKSRTRDIYGVLPNEVESLFSKRNIDLLMQDADIEKLEERQKTVDLILGESYLKIRGFGNILFEAIIPYLSLVKVSYMRNIFKISMTKQKNWIKDLESILISLVNIKETNKIKEIV